MEVHVGVIQTVFNFNDKDVYLKNDIYRAIDAKTALFKDGYKFSPAYKRGYWDGKVYFLDRTSDSIPTGLLSLVLEALGELQGTIVFEYQVQFYKPDKFIELTDLPESIELENPDSNTAIILRDYQMSSVRAIVDQEIGIINASTNSGKTEIAAGLIKMLAPYLESGETIAFFTGSTQIFNQSAKRLSDRLGVKVGKIGAGEFDIQQINLVMLPTVDKALTSDPEAGLKLTAKERKLKRLSKEIAPRFISGQNQRLILENFLRSMEIKTKTDQVLKDQLEDIFYGHGTDREIQLVFRGFQADYYKLIEKKNKKVLEKHEKMVSFMDSVTIMIVDEAHHTNSDQWYKSLLTCKNAQYRVALTGSIDKDNKVLRRRMQALFGSIVAKTTNQQMIDRGVSAKPKVTMITVDVPSMPEKNKYLEVYQQGVVANTFRNLLIAKLAIKEYNAGGTILVVVNWKTHAKNIAEFLTPEEVPFVILDGSMPSEERESVIADVREGRTRILIATSLIDEGVDIPSADVLIMAAAGKSSRQLIQRVGRIIRRKEGSNTASIYDFMDTFNKHTYEHAKIRRELYLAEGFELLDIK